MAGPPDLLTAEWCRGRRVPYVPPLRLYIFIAAIFFLVLALSEPELVKYQVGEESESPAPAGASEGERASNDADDPDTGAGEEGSEEGFFARALEDGEDVFEDRFLDRFGRLSLLLPPLFALLLAVVYRRRRRFFVEHLVFALHLHAFAFLVLSGTAFLPTGTWDRGLKLAVTAILGGYLFLALTRVYSGRWWVTAGRLTVLAFAYMMLALLPSLFLALLWTLWTAAG